VGKISVIVPVYNTEKYIAECLESLFNQTYKNIEILLINDGSNQECTEKLETLSEAHDNIRLFHFDANKGVGAARNFGVKASTGDFIYFLDSDDYIPEKTLEILIHHIKDNDMIRGRIKSTHFAKSFAVIFDGIYNAKIHTDEKYKFIKNKSALNFLIRKDFIISNHLYFAEDVRIYADLEFIVPALINVPHLPHVKEAIYFKRKRNAPILNPSLMQEDVSLRISDFIHMYIRLKDKYEDALADVFLDIRFLNFYRKTIVTFFKDEKTIESYFQDLLEAMSRVDENILKTYDYVLKKEVQTIKKGSLAQYKRVNRRHQFLRDFKTGCKSRKKFKRFLYKRFFNKQSIKNNWVFFESFHGRSYSDSPKYIYQHMIENNMNYKYIWCVNDHTDIPGNPIKIKRFSLRYYYYLAKSKYWVSNSRFPNDTVKREEHVYVQTWHGTPLKRLAGDMENVLMPGTNVEKYKRNFYNETQRWDYLVSPNAYSTNIFEQAFWFDRNIIESGYPRNDILYNKNSDEDIVAVKRKLGIPNEKKVILYAPTWRDDEYYGKGKYKFTLALDLQKMQECLGDEYIVLLRMHYFIASQMDVSDVQGFAFDVSDYEDIGELYLISDMLITDYSSVFFDYAHLKRPILFYTYDLDKYRGQLRGFYFDMEEEVPGPLLKTTDEVIEAIGDIGHVQTEYQNKYDEFHNTYCLWDHGDASSAVVKEVFEK